MTSVEVDIGAPPEKPDLQLLATSTLQVFNLLRPWYKCQYPSSAVQSIKHQAQAYMNALRFSISAAQYGHVIAEEVVSFARHIDSCNEEERQDYLRGMHDIARRGQENAEQACEGFRDVRRGVSRAIEEARHVASKERTSSVIMAAHLNDLEKGIPTLENFSTSISLYASWWNNTSMTQKAQSTRCAQIVYKYNKLRTRSALEKWKELQQEYANYIDQVRAIEDADPELRTQILQDAQQIGSGVPKASDSHSPWPQHPGQSHMNPAPADGAALLFAPIFALGRRPAFQRPMRKRDHIRAWGYQVWEEIMG